MHLIEDRRPAPLGRIEPHPNGMLAIDRSPLSIEHQSLLHDLIGQRRGGEGPEGGEQKYSHEFLLHVLSPSDGFLSG